MAQKSDNRDKLLDVLRGIAIISVVAVHSAQVSTITLSTAGYSFSFIDSVVRYFSDFGKYGVELFFFISGVLLARIYGARKDFSLRSYTARRFGRILPLWFVFSLGSFLVYLILDLGWWKGLLGETGGGVVGQVQVAISALFFLTWALIPEASQRAVPGGWSIESEMTHYALFPLFRNLSSWKLILSIALCGILAALNDFTLENVSDLYGISVRLESLSIFTTLPFFLGGLLVVVWDGKDIKDRLTWRYLPLWLLSALGLFLLMINEVPFGTVAQAVGFGLLAYGAALIFLRSAVTSNILSAVGKYSYFTYFFHFYILSAILNLREKVGAMPTFVELMETSVAFLILHFACFTVSLLLSQLLGALSYKYFENPILVVARTIK